MFTHAIHICAKAQSYDTPLLLPVSAKHAKHAGFQDAGLDAAHTWQAWACSDTEMKTVTLFREARWACG